jgi:hypothetical protein
MKKEVDWEAAEFEIPGNDAEYQTIILIILLTGFYSMVTESCEVTRHTRLFRYV